MAASAGAKTLLHIGTAQPDRLDTMVLVSATPYFPAPALTPMAFARRTPSRSSSANMSSAA
jgi:hypothetical protein